MKIIGKINVLILFIAIIFFGNTVYGASEKSLLLALNLECGADKKGKKPYRDNFFGFATEHSFHASRWWNGSGDRLGEIGQTTLNATRTNKSLVINGEGSWIDNKSKKSWKLQFVSKGDKSIIEHLENGIEGFEGSGQGRRECVIKLLNQVEASDAIQLGSYTKVISALRNQIDNFKERNDNLENLNNDYTQRIETLDTLITTLKKEKNTNLEKIASLNSELEKNKNNSEFEIKYEELTKQIKNFTNKLEISTKENINLEKEISLLKETENTLLNSIVDINKEIDSLTDINLSLMDKIDLYEKKEKELTQIIAENENQRQEEERLINEKKQQEEELAEERRLAEEKKLKEKEELEKLAQEELNQKLALLTEETDLEKAQNFLLNLERFIKENPAEFDIIIISEYFIATRSILDGDLNSTNKAKLLEFKDYVSQNSELYLNFSNEISKTTQNEKLNKINEAILGLENSINELKLIMVNNQQSANLQKWTDIIKLAEISLQELKSIEDLINSKKNIDDLIKFKKQADKAILDLNKTKDELKIYLQENLTTELAPLILDQIKVIEDSIVTENVEKITKTNEETKQFINKKIIEPEEKKKAEEIEKEKKALLEEQNKKFEEIFEKYNVKNDYQEQIVKLLYFLDLPFEKIEFSSRDNEVNIFNIGDINNTLLLDRLQIKKINKDYLDDLFKLNEKYEYLSDIKEYSELPELQYFGKIAESITFYGFTDKGFVGLADLSVGEIAIKNLDFPNFDKISNILDSSIANDEEKNILSIILSAKFDKIHLKDFKLSEPETASLKYFEITSWDEFSFKNIELQDYSIQEQSNQFNLEKFKISDFKLDKNFTYDLLSSIESQELLLSGDYSEIFNSFISLDNFEVINFNSEINNSNIFSLDNAKINNIKFDYFGDDKSIKVPTNFNFEINGADFNYEEFRDISGSLGFLDGLIDDLDYEKIKFDFKSGWEWDTNRNNILFDLDLGITDAASLAVSSNFIDLDTKILNIQGGPLLTYLMTSPKLKELTISLNDNSLKDKLLDYVANEQNMTTGQLKDFVIQSMDIYSNTLGIDQGLAKDFIEALSNFIEKSNRIVLSIKPLNPVSVNDLTPDVIGQNYNGLINKLNISIGN